jgi:hypothetical protein
MKFSDRGMDVKRDNSTGKSEMNNLPYMEGDDIFLKKKPVNLIITLSLAALAIALSVLVAKNYYKKVNDQERLKWESGRENKTKMDKENAKKHDLLQPLRENWAQYISANVVIEQKGKGAVKDRFIVLKNKSPKSLDKVVVSLYSVNWNGEASNVRSYYIQVGSKSRDVICLIKTISASSFSFCFDKDVETGGKTDPYYCNDSTH